MTTNGMGYQEFIELEGGFVLLGTLKFKLNDEIEKLLYEVKSN